MTNSQKKSLIKIILAIGLYIAAELIKEPAVSIALFITAYLIVGYGPISKACRNILNGLFFDENFLMTVATVGALILKQWDEAVAVMLFYGIGEWFEDYAVNRSRKSIADLMDITPQFAVIERNGTEEKVDPYDVQPGDIIIVRPGEKVPLDGTVIEGSSSLDTSALTGESLPAEISPGMNITSGFVNLTGMLRIQVSSEYDDCTVAKILDLIENSASKKAPVEKFITKFSKYYTPAVVFSAIALAIIPPLLFSLDWSTWVYRALLFLVISCPCALVISIPMAFFAGVGVASKKGILIKGSNYLEAFSNVSRMVFDKTGTLTTGKFTVNHVSSPKLLELAAHIEMYSNHPISLSIKEAYENAGDGNKLSEGRVTDAGEIPGKGVTCKVDGTKYYAGNLKLMKELGLTIESPMDAATITHIATGNEYLGYISVTDAPKPDAEETIKKLKALGVKKVSMLTGDNEAMASKVADALGIDDYHSNLLPADKVSLLEEMTGSESGTLAFVGDGINDAPGLAVSDVGIAMGGVGSQTAIEAADVVIMDDNISKIPLTMNIAGSTLAISKINIIFTLFVKFFVLLLGAFGIANMWMAVFADVGVATLCILNSLRLLTRHKF